jgi:hypothetical protein
VPLKVNKYVLIGLVVIVLFALYTVFFVDGKKKMVSVAAPLEPPKVIAQTPDMRTKEGRVQQAQDTMSWERDPFALPASAMTERKQADKQRVALKLLAIMEGTRGRVAIIDNEVVGKGDTVAGERVLDIGKETVTLILDGSKRVITIQEPR